ncbi:MAG: hypothetical protein KDJ38_10565 [Gammaproteobacteria bacterium]|nr:hypothetical protein [Gammaproteobacteria bacterium]
MQQTRDELLKRFHELQAEVEKRFEEILQEGREEFQYQLRKGKVYFRKEIREINRSYKIAVPRYIRHAQLRNIASAPLIYSVILPLVVMDLFVTVYQAVCFRIYRIPLVKRSDHIILDRHKLDYLNAIEKLNCLYCGYGNGLISYFREIFARTEQFWCPIKHSRHTHAMHARTEKFVEYGDAKAYRKRLAELRQDWDD